MSGSSVKTISNGYIYIFKNIYLGIFWHRSGGKCKGEIIMIIIKIEVPLTQKRNFLNIDTYRFIWKIENHH